MSGPGSQAEVRTIGDGRYALLEEVGRGGMGVVWHGEDRLIQRPVAIKEISVPRNLTAQDRDSSIRRLLREIRGAGRINDPAAVTVHDVLWDSDAGVVHIVMEFVEGSSLAEVLDRFGPMRPEWAAAIALEVLDALQSAHRIGIVHRDVKPSNILLPSARSRAKLADFGLAWMQEDTRLTRSDMIMGSPAYLSPEQVNGDPVSTATDMWQLGVTLYSMLSGHSPFGRTEQQAGLYAVVSYSPPKLDCGEPLASTVAGLLDKRAERRPDADDVRGVLEQYAPDGRSGSQDRTTSVRRRRAPRRRMALVVAGTALAIAAALVGGIAIGGATATGDTGVAIPARVVGTSATTWNSQIHDGTPNPEDVDLTETTYGNTWCADGDARPGGRMDPVGCDAAHDMEVFAGIQLAKDEAYPPPAEAATLCRDRFGSYRNNPWLQAREVEVTALAPARERWDERQSEYRHVVYCAVNYASGAKLPGSGLVAQ